MVLYFIPKCGNSRHGSPSQATAIPLTSCIFPPAGNSQFASPNPSPRLRCPTLIQLSHTPLLHLVSSIYSTGEFKPRFKSFKAMPLRWEPTHCPYMYEAETRSLSYLSLSDTVAVEGSTTHCRGERAIIKWQCSPDFKSLPYYQVYLVRLPELWEQIASPQD